MMTTWDRRRRRRSRTWPGWPTAARRTRRGGWHDGFTLGAAELLRHPDYRGPRTVQLGVSLARDGRLHPGVIGDASRAGRYDEQALKRVWHCVARFGGPELAS